MLKQVKPHSQPVNEVFESTEVENDSAADPMRGCMFDYIDIVSKMIKSNSMQVYTSFITLYTIDNMAKLKSEVDKWISMPDRDYLELVEDHILMTALRAAGLEELPIYKSAQSILKNKHIEVHLKPIKPQYK